MFRCRVNTFRRLDLLETFLAHYHQCDAVRQVQIIWSDPDNPAPLEWSKRYVNDKVVFEVHNTDSLNHRFHNMLLIPTEVHCFCAFSVLYTPAFLSQLRVTAALHSYT